MRSKRTLKRKMKSYIKHFKNTEAASVTDGAHHRTFSELIFLVNDVLLSKIEHVGS